MQFEGLHDLCFTRGRYGYWETNWQSKMKHRILAEGNNEVVCGDGARDDTGIEQIIVAPSPFWTMDGSSKKRPVSSEDEQGKKIEVHQF